MASGLGWRPWLLFFGVAFALTGPVWWTPDAFVGDVGDSDLHGSIWAYWWSSFSVQNGLNPFEGGHNFFPVGQSPVSQYNLLDGLLAAPLVAVFGIRVGFNLACVGILALAGWGMAFLARSASLSRGAALTAGLAMECSAYVLFHLGSGRPTQALVVFQLVALAGVVRLVRGDAGLWTPVWTGICAAAAALTYWFSLVFFLVAAVILGLSNGWRLTASIWRRIALSVAIGLALTLPFLIRLVAHYEALPGVGRSGSLDGSYGLEAAIESSQWPLWPLISTPFADGYSLSLPVMAFAVLGLTSAWKGGRSWLLLVGVGWLLSLGPYLRLSEAGPSGIPLPFLWIQEGVPFMERFWWPERWAILCAIGLCFLAGRGAEWTWTRIGWSSRRGLGSAAILLIAGSSVSRGSLFVDWSSVEAGDATLDEGLVGPVLSPPFHGDSYTAGSVLYSQVRHRQSTNNGLGQHLSRHRPPEYDRWVDSNALVSALVRMEQGHHQDILIRPEAVDQLLEAGFESVLVDPTNFTQGLSERWAGSYIAAFTTIWGEPDHKAGGGAWWKIRPISGPVEVSLRLQGRAGKRTGR